MPVSKQQEHIHGPHQSVPCPIHQAWIADDAKSPNALYYDVAKVNNFSQAAETQATIDSSSALTPSHAANTLFPEPHLAKRIDFFHETLFSPAISTLCNAIDAGLLHYLPGNITSSQVRKHICFYEAMYKGHFDQERQGIHFTKLQEPSTTLQRNAKSQELLKLSADDSNLLQQCNRPAPTEQRTTNFYLACQEAMGTYTWTPREI